MDSWQWKGRVCLPSGPWLLCLCFLLPLCFPASPPPSAAGTSCFPGAGSLLSASVFVHLYFLLMVSPLCLLCYAFLFLCLFPSHFWSPPHVLSTSSHASPLPVKFHKQPQFGYLISSYCLFATIWDSLMSSFYLMLPLETGASLSVYNVMPAPRQREPMQAQ